MLDRLKHLLGGGVETPVRPVSGRTVADVFDALRREVDPEVARAAATNPAEDAFYAQADRLTVKWHHYLGIYHRHLGHFRGTGVRLLEIGVHNGGSLQVWRRYLGPDAVIHGLDVDPRCAAVDDGDLTVHIGSQDDRELLGRIVAEMGGIDVVVDDGSHVWSHQIATFETLFPLLSDRGIYLCEDTHTSYWPEYGADRQDAKSFVTYARDLVDRLYAPYALEPSRAADDFGRTTACISFHDSIVAIEKAPSVPPFHTAVGRRAIV